MNVTSGWYDLHYRNYDAALGRFMQVDPLAASEMATYQYAGNNPVMFNDPMGANRADYNRGYRLSLQFFASDNDELKGLPRGDGLGGGYVDWDASNAGPSVDDIKQRDALRAQGYDAHLNAKGDVEIWEDESYIEWEYFFDDEGNLRRTGTPVIGTRKIVKAGNGGPGNPPSKKSCCDWGAIASALWNSPLMRQRVPDNITLEFNVSSATIVGGSATYSINLLTRGKDLGFHLTRTFQTSYGPLEFGFGANLGLYSYDGSASQVSSGSLLGPSRTVSGGWFLGGSVTGGYADWNSKISNPLWSGFSAGVGSTWGASYSTGETYPGWGNKMH